MKSKKKGSEICKNLKLLDIFGHPISLRYKNQNTYKSYMGATLTLIAFTGIITYFSILLYELVNRKNFTITTTLQKGMLDYG